MGILETLIVRLYMYAKKWTVYILPFKWPVMFIGKLPAQALVDHIINNGHKNALIISAGGVDEIGLTHRVIEFLKDKNLPFFVYNEIQSAPTILQIEAGYTVYRTQNCDAILAIGNGAVIDAAKLMSAKLKNKKTILKMNRLFGLINGVIPLYVIPTTSGSGAECTTSAFIIDSIRKRKFSAVNVNFLPEAAALDYRFTMGLPKQATVEAGMEALTHAVEAYVSRNAIPRTDLLACEAVRLIMRNIETVFQDGKNIEARHAMAKASYFAGKAVTQVGGGYTGTISHKIGAMYQTPQGLSNAVVLPHILEFSFDRCIDRLATLAIYSNLGTSRDNKNLIARAFITHIKNLNENFSIPNTIEQLKPSDVLSVVEAAISDARFSCAVPVYMSAKQGKEIVSDLIDKRIPNAIEMAG